MPVRSSIWPYSHSSPEIAVTSVRPLLNFYPLSHPSGNAKIAGMAKDVHLVGLRYNIIAAVFFRTFLRVLRILMSHKRTSPIRTG